MKILIEVNEGMIIPPFYGVAWVNYLKNSVMCMPIPLNVIAAFVRAFYIWIRFGYMPVRISARDAYMQGFNDGRISADSGKEG